jgi:exosortase/archaeosortase family protein
MKNLFKNSNEKALALIFVKLFLIWLSWKGFIHLIGEEKIPLEKRYFPSISSVWENFNYSMVRFLATQSEAILKLFGQNAYSFERKVWIEGANGVGIGNYCIGIQLMYYFSMLIVISDLSLKNKLVALPVGVFITQTLNIIRIVALALVAAYVPSLTVLFHDHIFNIIVFGTLITYYYLITKSK